AQRLCCRAPHIGRSIVGAAIVATEEDGSGEQCLLEQATELVLMAAQAQLFFSNERRFILRLSAAFFARQDFLGTKQLLRFAIDGLVQRTHPEDGFGLRLAALPRLFGPFVAFRADFSEREVNGNVPVHMLATPKI